MSFASAAWSDDEAEAKPQAPAPAPGAAAPGKVVRRKVKIIRRAPDGTKTATIATRTAKKRGRDDDEEMGGDGPTPAPAAAAAPSGNKRFRNVEGVGKARDLKPAPPAPQGVGRFHTVMDNAFSDVALPRPGSDPNVKSGAWIGAACRCLQCEATRVAQKLASNPEEPKTTLVIVDLDNYGYPQWVRHPAPSAIAQENGIPGNVFFWCFYGLGFKDHGHNGDPAEAVLGRSLFGALNRAGQVHFSPCGNYPQAADLAMQAVVGVMRNVHIALVTSDKQHIKACHKAYLSQKLLPGRAKKLFQTIDPAQHQNDGALIYKTISAYSVHTAEEDEKQNAL